MDHIDNKVYYRNIDLLFLRNIIFTCIGIGLVIAGDRNRHEDAIIYGNLTGGGLTMIIIGSILIFIFGFCGLICETI